MRGHPLNPAGERPISTVPKARPDTAPQAPVSRSRHPKPRVLMGEVAAPKGALIAAGREAFRNFMLAHRLQPTQWAQTAGVAPGEIMAFLTGRARSIAPATLEKLAAAAGTTPDKLLGP